MIAVLISTSTAFGVLVASLALAFYGRLWARSRDRLPPAPARRRRAAAFGVGIFVLLGALFPPLASLGERMFLLHTVQHIALMDVAPILLIAGLSGPLLEPLHPWLHRFRRAWQWLTRPVAPMVLYAGTLWIWHAPPLYNLALASPGIHVLQHATMLAVGLVFWWHVVQPIPSTASIRGPGVFPFMGFTKFATGVLASLLTFLPDSGFVYEAYVNQPRLWGLSAAEDQQLGGALLVTEELVLMTAAFGFMFIRMLAQADRDDEAREQLEQLQAGDLARPRP